MNTDLEGVSPIVNPSTRYRKPKRAEQPATVETVVSEQNEEIQEALDLPTEPRIIHIERRRTEDEMRRALRLLVSGERRPRDDESPLIMEDTINEVFALRQLTLDLMQGVNTNYQRALAAIRSMTEK